MNLNNPRRCDLV